MKKTTTLALVGLLATSAMVITTFDANAHRVRHHHHHHHHHHGHVGHPGAALAVGTFFGLALGAATAHAWRAPPPPPVYYAPPPPAVHAPASPPTVIYHDQPAGPTTHVEWCAASYPGYSAADNTWINASGQVEICYSPY